MRSTLILTLLILILSFQISCTSLFIVDSDQEKSNVYYVNELKNIKRELGQTPFEINSEEFRSQLKEELAPGEFFTIVVEKPGFIAQSFSVPTTQYGFLINRIDAKLKEGKVEKEKRLAKDILDRIFLAQKFALTQQFDKAQTEVDKILVDFPGFPKALSMRASIFFAQKNYVESIKWYEEAIKADPQMDEAIKMLARVKTLQGGDQRLPASGNATPPTK